MYRIMKFVFILSISVGAIYNVGGVPFLLCVTLLLVVSQGHILVDTKFVLGISLFCTFIIIKYSLKGNYSAYSDYHSIKAVVKEILEIIVFAMLLYSIKAHNFFSDVQSKGLFKFFLVCYHSTLIVSIFILMIVGRNTYRLNVDLGGIFLAPQYYIFMSIAVSMMLFGWIIDKKGNLVVNLILMLINIVYVFMANYTTQILILCISFFVVLIEKKIKSFGKRVIVIIIVGVLAVSLISCLATVIIYLNNNYFAENEIIYNRLNELVKFLKNESITDSDLGSRFELISLSISSFKKHYFFGVPFSEYNTTTTGLVVGGHCEWLDDLARYGLIGTLFGGVCLLTIAKKLISNKQKVSVYERSLCWLVLLYGFVNPCVKLTTLISCFILSRVDSIVYLQKSDT